MTTWEIVFAVLALPLLYGLHKFCLHLEERGYLYYWHKKPKGGGGSAFLQLQDFYEPQIKHVIDVENLAGHASEADRHVPAPFDPIHNHTRLAPTDRDEPEAE